MFILLAICLFAFTKNEKVNEEQNVQKNEILNEEIEESNSVVENEIVNELQNEEIAENMVENTQTEETSTETLQDEPATAEEKAIDIVKKDWKETNNTKITVEGMNENGSYIVVVRNSQTTEALAFYSVNISDGTFNKREMN